MNPARHQRICAEIQEAHKKEIEKMTAELEATKKAVQQNYFRVVEVTAELELERNKTADWLIANGPNGWIEKLRKQVENLTTELDAYQIWSANREC